MLYGIDNTPWNISTFNINVRIFHRILAVPRNIVMDEYVYGVETKTVPKTNTIKSCTISIGD